MLPHAIIFDFDLTLADSRTGVIECVNHAFQRLDLPSPPDQQICETIGLSMAATLEYLTGITDQQKAEVFYQYFVERADEVMADHTSLYPTVSDLVQDLHGKGIRLGIVSSKRRYRIEGILERESLSDYFQIILGAGDVAQHKPHPAGLQIALDRLNCPPEEVFYVGDHAVDGEAAQRAGIPFVAVLTGMSIPETFADYNPVAILDDLSGLKTVLREDPLNR